jgi:uncharacterized protein
MDLAGHSAESPTTEGTRRHLVAVSSTWIVWGYLVLITLAELLTSLGQPQVGLLLHTLILIGLIANTVIGLTENARRLALALTLGPLIRILSLGLPLRNVPQVAWYPLVSIPLLIATAIIVRQLHLSRGALGLQRGNLRIEIALFGWGLGLGWLEFMILRPPAILPALTWQTLLIPALSLLIFTGFTEEVIFRGLLQSLARPVLGRWALTYVALLFGVLHIGYLSFLDVLFVFSVGFLFAYIVSWSGSILGVTLAHGLTNTMLFLVLPYLAANPDHPLNSIMPLVIVLGSAAAVFATGVLWRQAYQEGRFRWEDLRQLRQDVHAARAWSRETYTWGAEWLRQAPPRQRSQALFVAAATPLLLVAVIGVVSLTRGPDSDTPQVVAGPAATATVTRVDPTITTSPIEAIATPADQEQVVGQAPQATIAPTTQPVRAPIATNLPWPDYLPEGMAFVPSASWPFQVLAPDQAAVPFLVFGDDTRWLVLRPQPWDEALPPNTTRQTFEISGTSALLLTYPDQGFALQWEHAGQTIQLSGAGLALDQLTRVAASLQPMTEQALRSRIAAAAAEHELALTTLWPSFLPPELALAADETAIRFPQPGFDDAIDGYEVVFRGQQARLVVGGGSVAPLPLTGDTETIQVEGRTGRLTIRGDSFQLILNATSDGTDTPVAFPARSATGPQLPLVQHGRIFVAAKGLDRAIFDRIIAGLYPVAPDEMIARINGQDPDVIQYLWPSALPTGYAVDPTSLRASPADVVLQGGRPAFAWRANGPTNQELRVEGSTAAYIVPEGPEFEQLTAEVRGHGATVTRSNDGVTLIWTEQGTFYRVNSSTLSLDQVVDLANNLEPIDAAAFAGHSR